MAESRAILSLPEKAAEAGRAADAQTSVHCCLSMSPTAILGCRLHPLNISVDDTCMCAGYIGLLEAGQHLGVLAKLRSCLECLDCRNEPDTAVLTFPPDKSASRRLLGTIQEASAFD